MTTVQLEESPKKKLDTEAKRIMELLFTNFFSGPLGVRYFDILRRKLSDMAKRNYTIRSIMVFDDKHVLIDITSSYEDFLTVYAKVYDTLVDELNRVTKSDEGTRYGIRIAQKTFDSYGEVVYRFNLQNILLSGKPGKRPSLGTEGSNTIFPDGLNHGSIVFVNSIMRPELLKLSAAFCKEGLDNGEFVLCLLPVPVYNELVTELQILGLNPKQYIENRQMRYYESKEPNLTEQNITAMFTELAESLEEYPRRRAIIDLGTLGTLDYNSKERLLVKMVPENLRKHKITTILISDPNIDEKKLYGYNCYLEVRPVSLGARAWLKITVKFSHDITTLLKNIVLITRKERVVIVEEGKEQEIYQQVLAKVSEPRKKIEEEDTGPSEIIKMRKSLSRNYDFAVYEHDFSMAVRFPKETIEEIDDSDLKKFAEKTKKIDITGVGEKILTVYVIADKNYVEVETNQFRTLLRHYNSKGLHHIWDKKKSAFEIFIQLLT